MRRLTERLTVSPQLRLEDLPALKAQGVTAIINNRPDGEEPDQLDGETIRQAAEKLGLAYAAAPFKGRPAAEAVQTLRGVLADTDGSVHAFCRSGTRSAHAWALMAVEDGMPVEAVVQAGREAGYDVGPLFF